MTNKKINVAILGASHKPERHSNQAVRLLTEKGYTVFPVNPRITEISGIKVFPRLADINQPVHTITVYMTAERSSILAAEILAIKPRRVIFNPGAENPDLTGELASAGIEALNACTLVLLKTGGFDSK